MTTSPVMTVTDELLAELEEAAKNACSYGKDDWFKLDDLRHDIELDDAKYVATSSPFVIVALTAELRRLRAENADLARVVKDVRWRVADTTDQLQAYGHNGDRLYGLDEWSVPIRNLNIAIGMLEKASQ